MATAWTGCGSTPRGLVDGRLELPHSLREVSGIVAVDPTTIACVQDEVGALYFVDLSGERPVREEPFGPRGDYEGLARVGDDFWVLRSDGELLCVRQRGGRLHVADRVRLPAGFAEWEGICYDAERRLLLVLAKHDDTATGPRVRPVFGVDPATLRVLADPVATIDVRRLAADAAARDIVVPTKGNGDGVRATVRLHCSELLALPERGELLVLSAADHVLLRLDRTGGLLGCRALDEGELPQPEGLALLPDGRLLVASEGDEHGHVRVVPLP